MIRDLALRLTLDENAIRTLEQANAEMNELKQLADEAQSGLSGLGDTGGAAGEQIAGGLDRAAEASVNLVSRFREVQPVIGALGIAGLAFSGLAARAASEVEFARVQLMTFAGKDFPLITRAIEAEASKWGGLITASGLTSALIPVVASIPGQARIIAEALNSVNEAVVMMGGGPQQLEKTWRLVAQAISTGSADVLTRVSRLLEYPLIRGEEARRIAEQMQPGYSAVTNAMILMRALTASQRIEQEALNPVLETTRARLHGLAGAWRELVEQIGEGTARAMGKAAAGFQPLIEAVKKSGIGKELGEWLTITGGIMAALGGPMLLAKLLGVIGIGTGTVMGLLTKVLPWLGGIAFVGLAIQDLIKGMPRRDEEGRWVGGSVLIRGALNLWDFLNAQIGGRILAAWNQFTDYLHTFHVMLDEYVVQPVKNAFRVVTDVFLEAAETIARWLGIRTPQQEAKEREQASLAALAFGLHQAARVGPAVVRPGGEIDWVASAEKVFGEDWQTMAWQRREALEGARDYMNLWEQTIARWPSDVYVDPELQRKIDELAARELRDRLSLKGVSPAGPAVSPTLTLQISPAAVQVTVNAALAMLSEEEKEKVIEEAIRAVEAQLRASLNEEPVPGVR